MPLRVTIRDVAKKAGVSINTASRALNGKPDVSKETRSSVLAAAQALGYVPDGVAQGLRVRRTKTIGVIVSDIGNPFFSAVVRGIEEVTRKAGYQIILANTDESLDAENAAVSVLLQKRVDGILMTPSQKSLEPILLLQRRCVPTVLMARRFANHATDFVVNDDAAGGFLATDYLIQKGRKQILFLNGPPEIWSASERLRGYLDALAKHGLPADPELIVSTTAKMDGAYRSVAETIARGVRFTAVYAFSDLLAMGAIRALKEAGLKVPRDVAVVGHDNIDFADILETPLTTIDMSKTRLGREAARILLAKLDECLDPHKTNGIVLTPRLVIRDSA